MLVSNDTGPGHLAAAVGATVVSVLGPTKPEQWAPWGSCVHIIRRWPDWATPDEVMAKVESLLSERAS
jgi:heptosyltransferase-2